jgi:hypothetical protein
VSYSSAAEEVSLVFGVSQSFAVRSQFSLRRQSVLCSEKSAISKSCSNEWSGITQRVFSCELLCQQSVIVMCAAVNRHSE